MIGSVGHLPAGLHRRRFPLRDILMVTTGDARADRAAGRVAINLGDRLGGLPIIGADGHAIIQQARHAGLVVLGRAPRRRYAAAPPTDTAPALARRLGLPVVIVPDSAADGPALVRERIVCGVRDGRDIACLRAAGALADALDMELVLVHVVEPPAGWGRRSEGWYAADRQSGDRTRERVAAIARAAGRHGPGQARRAVVEGLAARELLHAAEAEAAGLIAVSASDRGWLARRLMPSVSHDLVRQTRRPLLICPRRPLAGLGLWNAPEGNDSVKA